MRMLTGVLLVMVVFSGAAWGGDFTDNLDGTVTDNTTGLMWQQPEDITRKNWEQAIAYCETVILGTFEDWRLPNVKELFSITDKSKAQPSIDPVFTNTSEFYRYYWSSTSDATYVENKWLVDFSDGSLTIKEGWRVEDHTTRCVTIPAHSQWID